MRRSLALAGVCVLSLGGGSALGQPVIDEGGVVGAMDYSLGGSPLGALAPGALGSVFGSGLAPGAATAKRTPWPFELLGVRLEVGGRPAPLVSVSPRQINFQMPLLMSDAGRCSDRFPVAVVLRTPRGAARSSASVTCRAPRLLSVENRGCGQVLAFQQDAPGQWSVNAPDNAAAPGQRLRVYGTGMGNLREGATPPAGLPAPAGAAGRFSGVLVGGQSARTHFSGRAEGLVGVDVYELKLPADTPIVDRRFEKRPKKK